jgi:hypothetical protein
MQPQEEWDMQYVRGKEIEKGIPEAMKSGLGKAMTMSRGVIPKDVWDSSVLGELAIQPGVSPVKGVQTVQAGPKAAPLQHATIGRPNKAEIPRPKRNIKKRTYGDASFEGYGEGFVDDDLQDTGSPGYSTGEGEDRGGQKRRKKVCTLYGYFVSMTDIMQDPGRPYISRRPSSSKCLRPRYGWSLIVFG